MATVSVKIILSKNLTVPTQVPSSFTDGDKVLCSSEVTVDGFESSQFSMCSVG